MLIVDGVGQTVENIVGQPGGLDVLQPGHSLLFLLLEELLASLVRQFLFVFLNFHRLSSI